MAGGVTPKQIYTALTAAGASTIQAIGIMANMLAESGLDPEAIGDQGTSFGLVQEHGSQYAGLVTGNPAADMNAQVRVIAQTGGFAAASGSTGAEAAANFSARYERCKTCQPGQASYNERVGNAATVAGWVSSGKWPASAGSAVAGTAGAAGTTADTATCALGFGGVSVPGLSQIPLIGSSFSNVGSFCLIRKTEVRAFMGGLLMLLGSGPFLLGALIVAAGAFTETRTGRAAAAGVTKAAEVVPVARIARRA